MSPRQNFTFSQLFRAISLIAAIGFLLMAFNNCGDFRISPNDLSSSSVGVGEKSSTFPLPATQADEYRIVFFVDMSLSMVAGLCKDDAGADADDLARPNDPASPFCTKLGLRLGDSDGADPQGIRLQTTKKWIETIRDQAPHPERVKFSIVPFTGGKAEMQRDAIDNLKFEEATPALAIVDALIQEQRDTSLKLELPVQQDEANPLKMGTSTPIKRLEKLRTIATEEATRIRDQGSTSFFEMVLISDGVPKPRTKHIYNAIAGIWKTESGMAACVAQCGADLMNYLEGTATLQQIKGCGFRVDAIPRYDVLCFQKQIMGQSFSTIDPHGGQNDIITHMTSTWGDFVGNTPNKIVLKIDALKRSLSSIAGLSLRVSSALVYPTRISRDVRNSLENWIVRSKEQKVADRIGYITSSELPFTLIDIGDSLESYKIGSFMLLNPTVRINSQGVLVKDSDADGLPDDQDPYPSNPRGINGKCLDSLTVKNRCPASLGCDPLLDEDGDGLNECEELILGSNALDFDSDDDSIPDSLEYLYGYNFLSNDLNENNPNQKTNVDFFKMGVPKVRIGLQNLPQYLMNYTVNEMGYVEQMPTSPRTGLYSIQVDQVPLLPLQPSQGAKLFYDRSHAEAQAVPFNIFNVSHGANQVPVVALVRIDNTLNASDVRWAYHVIMVDSQGLAPIEINLMDLIYLKTRDPQRGGF